MTSDDDIIEDDQVTVEPPKKTRYQSYTDAQIVQGLTLAGGDVEKTAVALKMKAPALRARIEGSRYLKGSWHLIKTKRTDTDNPAGMTMAPGEMHTRNPETRVIKAIGRTPEHGEGRAGASAEQLANEVALQDLEVLISGMEKAGIAPDTVKQLRDLSAINLNTGMFLVTSLDMVHRTMIKMSLEIFEEALFIKKTYLRDMQLSEQDRLAWQRHFTEICDQLGKAGDRILAGTQALAAIHEGAEGKKGGKDKRNKFQEASEAPAE